MKIISCMTLLLLCISLGFTQQLIPDYKYVVPALEGPIVDLECKNPYLSKDTEILATDGSQLVLYSTKYERVRFKLSCPSPGMPNDILLADVTRDGHLDIVYATIHDIESPHKHGVLLTVYDGATGFVNETSMFFKALTSDPYVDGYNTPFLGMLDINSDGKQEFLFSYVDVYSGLHASDLRGPTIVFDAFPKILYKSLGYSVSKLTSLCTTSGKSHTIADEVNYMYTNFMHSVTFDFDRRPIWINSTGSPMQIPVEKVADPCTTQVELPIGSEDYKIHAYQWSYMDTVETLCLVPLSESICSVFKYSFAYFCESLTRPFMQDSNILIGLEIKRDSSVIELWRRNIPGIDANSATANRFQPETFVALQDYRVVVIDVKSGVVLERRATLPRASYKWGQPLNNGVNYLIGVSTDTVSLYSEESLLLK